MINNLEAVIWDFGGVLTSSPFEAFNRYEAEHGVPVNFIRGTNAWARLERSELDADGFDTAFRDESAARGHAVPGKDVLALLSGDLRPGVVRALTVCKQHVRVGCITNNAPIGRGAGMSQDAAKAEKVAEILSLFEHVLESSKIGLRKPDPRIYALMCEALKVDPGRCIYIDDLGINLKPARAMGMHTIKVLNEFQLLEDLRAATGFTGF